MRYCPNCKKVAVTKALVSYSQVDLKGIRVLEKENCSSDGILGRIDMQQSHCLVFWTVSDLQY
jgi:hypothetical protein